MAKTPDEYLSNILEAGEPGMWKPFFIRAVAIFGFAVLLYPTLGPFFSYLFFTIFAGLNLVVFLYFRYFYFRLTFTSKTTIVFAYNLEGIEDVLSFRQRYLALIKDVRNKLDAVQLGEKVKIVSARSDIRFKNKTAAEAKTLFNIPGTIIVVWGHVTGSGSNKKFVTNFSYEFGHPKNVTAEDAKGKFSGYLDDVLFKKVFSIPFDLNNFSEQVTPVVTFLCGIVASTLGAGDRAAAFLESFRTLFNGATDNRLRKNLNDAFSKTNEILSKIYFGKINATYLAKDKDLNGIVFWGKKMLDVEPSSYPAHIMLAFAYEHLGEASKAEEHQKKAANYAPRGQYLHVFNWAYFFLKKGNYEDALAKYESIPDSTESDIGGISNDLYEHYQKDGDPSFLFADGYVSYRWGDRDGFGRPNLTKFLETTSDDKYQVLINKAEQLLNT